MDFKDRATSTIPESPNQALIKKVDRRNITALVVALAVLVLVVMYSILVSTRLQQVIDDNQLGALEARKQNTARDKQSVERDERMKGYVKCVVLLRFDDPGAIKTREAASAALDNCAANNSK